MAGFIGVHLEFNPDQALLHDRGHHLLVRNEVQPHLHEIPVRGLVQHRESVQQPFPIVQVGNAESGSGHELKQVGHIHEPDEIFPHEGPAAEIHRLGQPKTSHDLFLLGLH